MARLPSPRHPVHCSLWIPGLREGDDSPLRTSFRRAAPATYPTRQLPTPRSPPCGLNGTSQIPLPRCAESSSQLSLPAYHAAHAAVRQLPNAQVAVCNAVVLERISSALNHLPRRRRACPGDPEFLSTERQQSRWPGQARSRLEREVRRSNPTGIRANRPQFPYLAWSHAMTPRGEVLANKATRDRLLPLSQL